MALPPVDVGAVNAIEAVVLPAVATSDVGAPGTVYGVTETDDEADPVPAALTALSKIVYVVPFVKPVIETGDVVCAGENAVYVEPLFVEY